MMVLIGRVRCGLLSMFATIIPVVLVFGIMGVAKSPLDMATILVGSIVIGLVVDDTIHFLHHFRREFDGCGNVEVAVKETLGTTGRVLCEGFLIDTTSFLANTRRFGRFTGWAGLFSLAAAFFLMPALLRLAYSRDLRHS